ncbi:hypothetical protein MBT84_45370 [Streptomyces sp. MBT84]|nr:hypothetical protein [Streptomyces sp. MBT84]
MCFEGGDGGFRSSLGEFGLVGDRDGDGVVGERSGALGGLGFTVREWRRCRFVLPGA